MSSKSLGRIAVILVSLLGWPASAEETKCQDLDQKRDRSLSRLMKDDVPCFEALKEEMEKWEEDQKIAKVKENKWYHLLLEEMAVKASAGITNAVGEQVDSGPVEDLDSSERTWDVSGGYFEKKLLRDFWVAWSPDSYMNAEESLSLSSSGFANLFRPLVADRIKVDANVGYGRILKREAGDADPKFEKTATYEFKVVYEVPLDELTGIDLDD